MQIDRNYGMAYPCQPILMPPMMPFNQEANSIEQKIMEIEKRLTILEANLNNQSLKNNMANNYQMI